MTAQQMWNLICNSQEARGMSTLERFPRWSELNELQRAALEEAREDIETECALARKRDTEF